MITNKEHIHNKHITYNKETVTEGKLSELIFLKTYFQHTSLCIHYIIVCVDPSISMSYVIKIIYFSPLFPLILFKISLLFSLFLSFQLPFLTINSLFFDKIRLFDKLSIFLIPLFSMTYKIKGLFLHRADTHFLNIKNTLFDKKCVFLTQKSPKFV